MSRVKDFYHDDLERRRCVENERCGQCGEDAELDTEAWTLAKLCPDCFAVENGPFGAGA